MKKYFLILSFFFLNARLSSAVIQNSNFSILSINQNNYEFLVVSIISATYNSQCVDMYMHPVSLSADTIYIRGFYNISGFPASISCIASDTINFQNVYPNANVINISTGVFWEDPNNPGVYDSIWNIKDSNFNINPLLLPEPQGAPASGDFSIYPNPTTGALNIQGKMSELGNQVRIYDLTGRLIATHTLSNLPSTLDVSMLHNGLYMIGIGSRKRMLRVWKE